MPLRYTSRSGGDLLIEKLGELQTKILKHMLSCPEAETVSHISKELGALQPAVFRSVKPMIEEEMIEKMQYVATGVKKELVITEKGMAIAIINGIKHEKLTEYLTKSGGYKDESDKELHDLFRILMQLNIGKNGRETFVIKRALEFMILNGWYDDNERVLDQAEKMDLFIYLIPYIINQLTDPKEVESVVRLIDDFRIDRRIFASMLLNRVESIFKAVNEYLKYTKLSQVGTQGLMKNIEILIPSIAAELKTDVDDVQRSITAQQMTPEKLATRTKKKNEIASNESKILKKIYQIVDTVNDPHKAFKQIDQAILKYRPKLETERKIVIDPEQRRLLNFYRSMEIITNSNFHVDPKELYNKIMERVDKTKDSILPNEEIRKIIFELESTQSTDIKEPITKT